MMDYEAFVGICDKYLASCEAAEYRTREGYKEVYEKARQKIGDSGEIFSAVVYLRQKLVILHHQGKLDYTKYIPVLDSIREAARCDVKHDLQIPPKTDWVQLIKIIIENRKELVYFDQQHPLFNEDKLHTFAFSYIRLLSIGVEFSEIDYKFYISEGSNGLINSEIERICREYGGDNLLDSLASCLGRTYNPTTGRFMEYRNLSMGTTEIHAAIPFGYLLAVASKYAGTRGNKSDGLFQRLVNIVGDIVVVYEVQPYSQFEAMHLTEEKLIEFIRNNIFYDNFVGVTQAKASYASSLISLLSARFDGDEYRSYGVSVKDAARVAIALISKSETKKLITVTSKELSQKCNLSEFKVTAVMDGLLSAESGLVNLELKFPPSSLDINHYFKPTIKLGKSYKILPKSIASVACVNTVCAAISHPNGKWDNEKDSRLGYVIEDYLRSEFANKGISITYGERVGGESKLEVDLLCDTDEDLYIFEMKKKGLTRQAQSGDEGQILIDLADSVLASHFQAMRIENSLKTNGSLRLKNKDGEKTILLDNRNVRRISVSLPDFGALQDKTVLQRLLTIAAVSSFKHQDSAEDKKLNKWRKHSEGLKNLAVTNGEFGEGRVPFHNSLFMSIPQIMMVLENSDTPNDFFKHIKSFIGVTTGSRDTYTEFVNRLTFLDRCKAQGLVV
ncbi:hypothetical protein GLGCALEP_03530 [Pseudomonas sp. MM221]|nr:hypothetical protein DBADOPDK_03456 [Pseudomonas sp. MM223]CAI3804606.1 hypothetical protein GLGCALEP_03530 [Pseudomonas sp. MM221]